MNKTNKQTSVQKYGNIKIVLWHPFFNNHYFTLKAKKCFSYREVNTDGFIVVLDFVSQVIEKSHNRGLLQRHGGAETRAHDGGPRHSNALPVMQICQAHSDGITQKAIQGTLKMNRESSSLGFLQAYALKKQWHRYAREKNRTLNCCCVTLLLSGFKNSSTWGIRSLQQKL